ncbi:Inositol 1,4,5-trisphosphate receptor type 1 [Balamuthia mandrillaris]
MPSLSAAQRVKNPDNEKGERLLDSSHSNLVLDLHKLPKEDMFLKRGDSISLFSIESSGYLSANGFADSACHITPIYKDNTVPDHFSDCVFEVYPGFKYDAQNALNAKLESLNRGRASIKRKEDVKASDLDDIEIELMELKKSEEDEAAENMNEYRQTAAQPIFYGQTIQLLHKTSNKFVTVTVKQIADIEKHCLRVGLDQTGNEGSYFTILPRFKIRSEGEMVQIGDQVLLVSKEHDLYLHSSREKLTNDHWESTSSLFRYKEVNAATVLESWRVLPFASCLSSSSSSPSSSLSSSLSSPSSGTVEKDILMAGDVIRLFHKEAEGYLIFETTDDEDDDDRVTRTSGTGGKIYLQQIVAAEALKSGAGGRNLTNMKTQPQQHQELLNSNALWMVELKRTNRGGAVCYDRLYRFKHMATGHYLSAVPVKRRTTTKNRRSRRALEKMLLQSHLHRAYAFD